MLSTNLLPRFTPLFLRLMSCPYSRDSGFIAFVNFWHTFYTCHVWLVNLLYNALHDGYMNLFVNPMQVGFLLSCSKLCWVNSQVSSNEMIFKGSYPLIVCANNGTCFTSHPLGQLYDISFLWYFQVIFMIFYQFVSFV